jgi:hypothetical protein
MATRELMTCLPKGWSQQQCANCGMVFALPPILMPSGVNTMEMLREELERHVQQMHMPTFLSDWKAEHQSR